MARPRARNSLPYKEHPLYKLRLVTVITTVVGLILTVFSIFSLVYNPYQVPFFVIAVVFLFISLFFVLHDLMTYAASKVAFSLNRRQDGTSLQQPVELLEEEPKWPSKRLIITDLILAIIFQWLFWIGFFAIINTYRRGYYGDGSETIEAYANLANFAASIEHAIAFWKETVARKKSAWREDFEARPCKNCGHVNRVTEEENALLVAGPTACEAGPSRPSLLSQFAEDKITLPKWVRESDAHVHTGGGAVEAKEEHPLLVTPDETDQSTTEIGESSRSQGYGSLDQSVGSAPETVVKKKDKGKKRFVEAE